MFAHDHKQRSGERDLTPRYQCADRHGSQPGSRTEGQNGAIRTAPPSSSSSPPPSEMTSLSGFLVEAEVEAAGQGAPRRLQAGGASGLCPLGKRSGGAVTGLHWVLGAHVFFTNHGGQGAGRGRRGGGHPLTTGVGRGERRLLKKPGGPRPEPAAPARTVPPACGGHPAPHPLSSR